MARKKTPRQFTSVEDSGRGKRQAESGAVRERATGKGRFDLITPFAEERLAVHYENGATKYSDRNWEKGMPLSWFLDSMDRHVNKLKQCVLLGEEPAEDHLAAIAWNAFCFMHTEDMITRGRLPQELDDLPNADARRKARERKD